MKGTAHPVRSRQAAELMSLVAAVVLALWNPVNAGAACNQFCAGSSSNTFFGLDAGIQTVGDSNTAIGAEALGDNTTGSDNTAVGDDALNFSTTGESIPPPGHRP